MIAEGLRTRTPGLKVARPIPKATSAWVEAADNRVELLGLLFKAEYALAMPVL